MTARDLTKAFGGVIAVKGASLDVVPGEVHGLIGPNGSGKSTLLSLLGGSLRPDSGSLHVFGEDVTAQVVAGRIGMGIARTLQRTEVFPEMTALEHVLVGTNVTRHYGGALRATFGTPLSRSEAVEARERASGVLEVAGLGSAADVPAGHLPSAEQRLLMIAMALGSAPSFLLLDEPSAGMAHGYVAKLHEFIATIASHGIGVLLVEHNLGLVRSLAQRVTVLDAGTVIASGPPKEVASKQAVRHAYLGPAGL
jgi:branched-chain amino acid transport system ATP-binding protein